MCGTLCFYFAYLNQFLNKRSPMITPLGENSYNFFNTLINDEKVDTESLRNIIKFANSPDDYNSVIKEFRKVEEKNESVAKNVLLFRTAFKLDSKTYIKILPKDIINLISSVTLKFYKDVDKIFFKHLTPHQERLPFLGGDGSVLVHIDEMLKNRGSNTKASKYLELFIELNEGKCSSDEYAMRVWRNFSAVS